MDEREYRNIKARIAYEEYRDRLPKCDDCEYCRVLFGRLSDKRACLKTNRMIDNRVITCPEWCPKREGVTE